VETRYKCSRVKFAIASVYSRAFPNPFFHRLLAADRVPVSDMAERCHLRSAAGHQLVVPSELMWPYGRFLYSVR